MAGQYLVSKAHLALAAPHALPLLRLTEQICKLVINNLMHPADAEKSSKPCMQPLTLMPLLSPSAPRNLLVQSCLPRTPSWSTTWGSRSLSTSFWRCGSSSKMACNFCLRPHISPTHSWTKCSNTTGSRHHKQHRRSVGWCIGANACFTCCCCGSSSAAKGACGSVQCPDTRRALGRCVCIGIGIDSSSALCCAGGALPRRIGNIGIGITCLAHPCSGSYSQGSSALGCKLCTHCRACQSSVAQEACCRAIHIAGRPFRCRQSC